MTLYKKYLVHAKDLGSKFPTKVSSETLHEKKNCNEKKDTLFLSF